MSKDSDPRDVGWIRDVMDRHQGALLRYAARIVGDAERAGDVVQETFLRLLESGRDGQDDHLAAWLFTVCRNRALDVHRKERRMKPLSEPIERAQPAPGHAPPAVAEQREAMAAVDLAMGRLPDNQQEVLRLKFQNGFSYKEIAGITGLSVSNVGFLIHTGVSALRDRLKAVGLIGRA